MLERLYLRGRSEVKDLNHSHFEIGKVEVQGRQLALRCLRYQNEKDYHTTLATSTLIVLFSEILKFSKKIKIRRTIFFVKKSSNCQNDSFKIN
jgi:hypothetical protein